MLLDQKEPGLRLLAEIILQNNSILLFKFNAYQFLYIDCSAILLFVYFSNDQTPFLFNK